MVLWVSKVAELFFFFKGLRSALLLKPSRCMENRTFFLITRSPLAFLYSFRVPARRTTSSAQLLFAFSALCYDEAAAAASIKKSGVFFPFESIRSA